jgi:hypothetical protein
MNERAHDVVRGDENDSVRRPISLADALTGRQPKPKKQEVFTCADIETAFGAFESPTFDASLLSLDEIGEILSHPHLGLGVDYLAFSFDTQRPANADPDIWSIGRRAWKYNFTFPVLNGIAECKLSGTEMVGDAYVSFNPSTCIHGPKSTRIATREQAVEIFHLVMDELENYVDLRNPRMATLVSRIDVSTDIPNIRDVEGLLDVASVSPITRQSKTQTFRSIKQKESVRSMSKKRGGFTVYNKSLQAKAPGRLVRFETTMRRRVLARNFPTMDDITDEACRTIFQRYLNPLIENLKAETRTGIDDILSDTEHIDTFIYLLGMERLKEAGYNVTKTDYWWQKKYKPFKKQYPHRSVTDWFD